MTDKLRELTERWRRRASLSDGKGDLAFANNKCADELLAILDADGDGGAVVWMLESGGCRTYWPSKDVAAREQDNLRTLGYQAAVRPLYPQPVRSGGVSDEDVRDTARLQWMVENSARVIASGSDDGMFDVRWCRPDDVMHGSGHFSDWLPNPVLGWREAIDAAMKGESNE